MGGLRRSALCASHRFRRAAATAATTTPSGARFGRVSTARPVSVPAPADVNSVRRAAQAIVAEHDGEVPRDLDALERLPGIGPYTARAVASTC